MITTRKLFELSEVEWLIQRQNPGSESVVMSGRLLGFNGTINITEALAGDEAELKLKIGGGAVQTEVVDFSGVNPEELTPADAVTALQAAGFTGCTFSVDAKTGRLQLKPTNETKWLQIYGDLAAALGFGGCKLGEGKGCYLWASMDGELKSAAETEDWEENKEIVNESTFGTPVKYTIPGKRKGVSIVLTDKISSRAAKQMIIGGTWIAGTNTEPETYIPPAPSDNEIRRVDLFTYSKMFGKYSNTKGGEDFIRERMYVGCVGQVKRTGGSGEWSDSEYSLTADSYVDEDGNECSSPIEKDYTIAQWDSMGMKGIIVADWENA